MKENLTIKSLNELVATFFHSYTVYKGYHWNYRGRLFSQYHALFDAHAEMIYDNIDEVAERIRQLDGVTEGRFGEYPKMSKLKVVETNDVNEKDLDKRLKTLFDLHETVISFLEELIDSTDKQGDVGTADLLTAMLEEHQKMRWMIKTSLGE